MSFAMGLELKYSVDSVLNQLPHTDFRTVTVKRPYQELQKLSIRRAEGCAIRYIVNL